MADEVIDVFLDANGVPCERKRIGDIDVIVHYDDYPDEDLTVVKGIPCTTALRTVIDLAVELGPVRLMEMIEECLARELFTLEEARTRLAKADMVDRRGAELVRRALAL